MLRAKQHGSVVPAQELNGIGSARHRTKPWKLAERIDEPRRVRTELEGRADGGHGVCLLEDRHLDSVTRQRERSAQAADPPADDGHPECRRTHGSSHPPTRA